MGNNSPTSAATQAAKDAATNAATLEVTLIDRTYKVACAEADRERILDAAAYLDRKMQTLRDAGQIQGQERLAVMVALDIAFEMLNPKSAEAIDRVALKRRIIGMQSVLDEALAPQAGLF